MTEEAKKLKKADAELNEQAEQKDRRIEELEALLMRALLRIEELEDGWGKIATTGVSRPPVMVLDASLASNAKKVASHLAANVIITGIL